MKRYDPSLFRKKRKILGIDAKELAAETQLSKTTILNAETNVPVQRSTILLMGLVLDLFAIRQDKIEAFHELEKAKRQEDILHTA